MPSLAESATNEKVFQFAIRRLAAARERIAAGDRAGGLEELARASELLNGLTPTLFPENSK